MSAEPSAASRDDPVRRIESRLEMLMLMLGGLYALALPSIWLLLHIAAKLGVFAP